MMQAFAVWLLNRLGWRLVGGIPEVRQCVIIFAPHTSNWDFPIMYLTKIAMGVKANFLGKHQLFRWPTGWFFRALGGIPVVRHEKHNVVTDSIQAFKDNPTLLLALAPEGTRSKTDHWRTGFYHIAVGAGVPLQLAFLDCRTRTLGLGPLLNLTGEIHADFARIRQFYQDKQGFKPELTSTVQPRPQA
ncbi:acyltransferase [Permianibacter sp. IMCC34836]|uniref:lysophospholipid acyltransferase family protein n=1 Tax=Permianibacter fluminis TaxID=2738515 RepID=UPI00155413E2|nr:lysophospholipid acyltransferase family protein [Permianibacter fluminis]NQD37539.1 acyltransferase [Permianibacter fluminis]